MGRIQGDLKERTLRFAKAILDVADHLPQKNQGWVVGRQLIRSGTSIGANVHEADHALTEADFAHKCSIARKEASETLYWLELCERAGLIPRDRIGHLAQEADEILRILSTIVKRTQQHMADTRKEPAHARGKHRV